MNTSLLAQHYHYNGPKLDAFDCRKPFWDSEKTNPLGGCIKVELLYVVDGDTAVFLVDGDKETVRFFIIDTPELRPSQQPYAIEAKLYLEELFLDAKEIILQSDIYDDLRDNTESKRLLAWVWVDGKLANYQLVQAGYARVRYVASPHLKYLKSLISAEKKAKRLKINLHQRS